MHAQLYIGTFDTVLSKLPKEAQRERNDVYHIRGGLCTVDNAAELCVRAARMPAPGTNTHLVISYDRYMPQAQNMLLKSIEDAAHVRWYFIVSRRDALLPTVRSRLSHVGGETAQIMSPEAAEFLAMTYPKRITLIAGMYTKAAKNDDEKLALHRRVQAIVTGGEVRAHKDPIRYACLIKDILFIRTYIDQPGASGKMLLELLALSA